MENEAPKLVATCPVCKHEFVADKKSKLLRTSYLIPQGKSGNQIAMIPSLSRIICTECGVEFYAGEALEELKKRAKGEQSSIVIAQPSVRIN